MLVCVLLGAGCSDSYDDGPLKGRVDELENRVAKLEELCRQMNTNIGSLQTLVDALRTQDYITGVAPVQKDGKEIGYTISFHLAAPITIYHGADGSDGKDGIDGKAPVIGVSSFEGVWYWTLDGEWLTDASGNKIRAEGRDGIDAEDGITPQLKIEDGWWWVSYDGKKSWTKAGQATGDKGEPGTPGEPGEPGTDSVFSGVQDGDKEVVFTLADGTTITIPKGPALTPFDIAFNVEGEVQVLPGASYEIGYTLTGATNGTVVETIARNGYRAEVVPADAAAGRIVVTTPDPAPDERIIVLVSDGADRTLMRYIHIAESILHIATDSYTVNVEGGTLEVPVETNIDYTVWIPEADRSWISLAQTRAAIRKETLTFTFQRNPSAFRSSTVELRTTDDRVVRTILFTQNIAEYRSLHVAEPGTLESLLSAEEKTNLKGLQLTGRLNTFDFDFIRTMPALETLDLTLTDNTTLQANCFENYIATTILLPARLTAIPDQAFYNSKITSIEIPATVKTIGDEVFALCVNISGRLILPEGLETIGSNLFSNSAGKMTGDLVLPDALTSMGDSAFASAGFDGTLKIGKGLTVISDRAFIRCNFTGNLTIPDQVTSIGRSAFEVSGFYHAILTIGSGVTSLGEYSLHFMPSKVYCKAPTPPSIFENSFYSAVSGKISYLGVPIGTKTAYEKAPHWNEFFTTITEVEF